MKWWVRISILLLTALLYAQGPVVPPNSVVNGASFTPAGQPGGPVAAGSIVSVFGSNLSASTAFASTVPLSTSLNQTSVTFNGTPAPLFFVSSGQVNAQLPFNTPTGSVTVVLTNAGQSSPPQTIQVAAFSPGMFSASPGGKGQGLIQIANTATFAAPVGSLPGVDARPANRGEFLTIYCTGLGPTSPPVSSGSAPPTPVPTTVTVPQVTVGGITAPVSFSGLAPGFVGLYQVNIQLLSSMPTGDAVAVQMTQGTVPSNTVTIAVR